MTCPPLGRLWRRTIASPARLTPWPLERDVPYPISICPPGRGTAKMTPENGPILCRGRKGILALVANNNNFRGFSLPGYGILTLPPPFTAAPGRIQHERYS